MGDRSARETEGEMRGDPEPEKPRRSPRNQDAVQDRNPPDSVCDHCSGFRCCRCSSVRSLGLSYGEEDGKIGEIAEAGQT